jgi:hypothetical protein
VIVRHTLDPSKKIGCPILRVSCEGWDTMHCVRALLVGRDFNPDNIRIHKFLNINLRGNLRICGLCLGIRRSDE